MTDHNEPTADEIEWVASAINNGKGYGQEHFRAMARAAILTMDQLAQPSALRSEGLEMAARWHDDQICAAEDQQTELFRSNPLWEHWGNVAQYHRSGAATLRALKET
jgi:hypothetical protein